MVCIYLNNVRVESSSSLADLLQQHKKASAHFAVAINKIHIPSSAYASTQLCAEDEVDILTPMQGG